jgi:hypothetical protein
MKGRDGRRTHEAGGGQLRTALIAGVIATLLAGAAAVVAAARTIDLGPKVGDILVFRAGARLPADWAFIVVTASDQLPVSCTLQPVVMASAGGSLVVEQRINNSHTFRVHWAGRQTSEPTSDCGPAADLLVSRIDLQLLSNAVGGPGVERRAFGGLTVSSW